MARSGKGQWKGFAHSADAPSSILSLIGAWTVAMGRPASIARTRALLELGLVLLEVPAP